MEVHDHCIRIISELKLNLHEVGEIIGCNWKTVQKKKSLINGCSFTEENLEKLISHERTSNHRTIE